MKRKILLHVLMDAAGGDGGAGGGAAAGGGADAGAAAAAAAAGGDGGQGGGGASLLAGAAAVGGETGAPTEFIPEKYRVTKEDGTLDLDASARKLAEAHGHLEKRLGSGDAPPKSADEYTVTVPDAFKDAFDPKADDGFKAFAGKMHELGLTQKQLDGVMEHYFQLAPQLVAGAAMMDEQGARAALEKVWGSGESFDKNVRTAYKGAAAIAQRAGVDINELMRPDRLGNNVDFLRMMAAIAPEFDEDTSPGGSGAPSESEENEVKKLMLSESYTNPKHPDYEATSKRVRAFFARKYPGESI